MTASGFDLARFIAVDEVDEHWAAPWARTVCMSLGPPSRVRSAEQWLAAIEELRDDLDARLGRREIHNSRTAASALFVLDLLQAAGFEPDGGCGWLVLGFVLSVSLTEEQWQDWLKLPSDKPDRTDQEKLTLAAFPNVLEVALFRRERLDVLRALYDLVRGRIHSLCEDCTRRSTSYEQWLLALIRLATSLVERHFVGIDSPQEYWDPLVQQLFSPDELIERRKEEHFFAEQFAHLYAAIVAGSYQPEKINELRREILSVDTRRLFDTHWRLNARQELRLKRSHFQLPPYLSRELDNYLRRPDSISQHG